MPEENSEQNATLTKQEQEPEEIVLPTSTGAVFKGKSWEAVAREAAKSVEHGSIALREQRETNRQLTEATNRQEPVAEERPRSDGFDKQKYFKDLAEDPLAATRTTIEKLFGASVEQIQERLNVGYEEAMNNHATREVLKFTQLAPDYPGTQEASVAMAKAVGLDKEGRGIPTAGEWLEAWTTLRASGQVKPSEPAKETRTKEEEPLKAPRSARGTQDITKTLTGGKRPEEMSMEEIQKVLNSANRNTVQ